MAATIKYKKSAVINDTTANGGVMSATDILNNSIENLFPHVTEAERTAGLDRYRKFFVKKEAGDLIDSMVFLYYLSKAADYFLIKAGTDTDTSAEADDYVDWAGVGEINEALDTESGNTDPFEVNYDVTAVGVYTGSKIAVIDHDAGTIEYLDVTNVSWASTVATITTSSDCQSAHSMKTQGTVEGTGDENFDLDGLTLIISINGGTDQTITFESDGMTAAQVETFINTNLTGGTAAADGTKVNISTDDYYSDNSIQVKTESTAKTELGLDTSIHYGTDGTTIATVLELGDIAAAHTAPVVNTVGDGDFNESGEPIVDYDIGAVVDDWTITFTSATDFTCVGTLTGSLAVGSTTVDYQPANGASYYFKIDKDAWTGTWAAGDTLTFSTTPSSKAVWIREIVPASTAAYANNRVAVALRGGS